jgi:hypothetical protein
MISKINNTVTQISFAEILEAVEQLPYKDREDLIRNFISRRFS